MNQHRHKPSAYETQVLEEIRAWRNPPESVFSWASQKVSESWNAVTDLAHKIPGMEWAMENVVTGVLELTNEITQDSVWTQAVLKDFHQRGHLINDLPDIHGRDLAHIDEVMFGLDRKYVGLASAEGVATGAAGAAGIVPDLVALVAINLRASGEMATYCGFDITDPAERVFALEILDLVARPGNNTKSVTLAPAVRTASRVARQHGTQILEQVGVGNVIEGLVRRLGMNLTEKKLAQMVPVTGALLGGGLNYLYTTKVCRTASYLYRERVLEAKYGAQFVARVDDN